MIHMNNRFTLLFQNHGPLRSDFDSKGITKVVGAQGYRRPELPFIQVGSLVNCLALDLVKTDPD